MAFPSAASLIISTKVRYLPRCGSERCSSQHTEHPHMTKSRFAKRWACACVVAVAFAASAAFAQDAKPGPTKPGKPISAGEVLSGELTAMRVRSGNKGKRVATYQLTS